MAWSITAAARRVAGTILQRSASQSSLPTCRLQSLSLPQSEPTSLQQRSVFVRHQSTPRDARQALRSSTPRSVRSASSVSVRSVRSVSSVAAMASSDKIQLYSIATPNGQKIGVALEEMEIPYDAHTVHIGKGEQFKPEFLKISPNNKIPAIVDPQGPGGKALPIFESGAILLYLAEKSGKFLPQDPVQKWETMEWLFFQVGGLGPMFGQFGVFFKYARDKCPPEEHPFPLERYTTEAKRLLGVVEKRLEGREFLVDAGYTVADMATFPWLRSLSTGYQAEEQLGLKDFPNVLAYIKRCEERPKTAKGLTVTPF